MNTSILIKRLTHLAKKERDLRRVLRNYSPKSHMTYPHVLGLVYGLQEAIRIIGSDRKRRNSSLCPNCGGDGEEFNSSLGYGQCEYCEGSGFEIL